MTTIGIIGAGHIGSQIARAALANGYEVVISNSRAPETLGELVDELGTGSRAATAAEAAAEGDFVVVTIPFKNIGSLPVASLAGKVVVDTNNYYWERDGHISELDDGTQTVSGALQRVLAESRVAKGFNAIFHADITADGLPEGAPNRRALVTASDFVDAAEIVTRLYNDIGFDTVNVGPLAESWRTDRDEPAYGFSGTAQQVAEKLAEAVRSV